MDGETLNAVCLECLRQLHTITLFEGFRIRDVVEYVKTAYYEYGIRPFELWYWTFDEEEAAVELWEKYRDVASDWTPGAAPPHHRLYGRDPP